MNVTKSWIAFALVTLLAAGCAGTTRDRNVYYSGFLGDYSKLVEGGDKQAERRYLRPHVDWAAYNKVLLDPVTMWRGDASRSKGVSSHDAQMMANYFYQLIYKDLKAQGLEIVATPMPDTLRVQVAITKLEESHVVMDVVSSVIPATMALSGLDKLVTGKPAFVGEAAIEVKVTDAMGGELLGAGVDHRVGGKFLQASHFTSWGEVQEIMQEWAAYGSYNLCELQKRSNCIKPKT